MSGTKTADLKSKHNNEIYHEWFLPESEYTVFMKPEMSLSFHKTQS